jgi:hypothetical protein
MPGAMAPPAKPFPGYKWRWAVLLPTEGLNNPAVFLGVLRALKDNEGKPPSAPELVERLKIVESETRSSVGSRVSLARSEKRNLIRNSGQYWKALDLLGDSHGKITLTDFGRRVADGTVTSAEFATTVIKTLELPNRHIETDLKPWDDAGLRIKPLELILEILAALESIHGAEEAFLTADELVKIVIPLAGNKSATEDHIAALLLYRKGKLSLKSWPDCAPESNDRRMAREFLLFLWHYGFCKMEDAPSESFRLLSLQLADVQQLVQLKTKGPEPLAALKEVRESNIPALAERKRVYYETLSRPQQTIFRKNVLGASSSRCLLTGVSLGAVLEAAHIIPVTQKGNDRVENGLCLRSDIHLLFDSGHLRINPSGKVLLSETASRADNYAHLPESVSIPGFVNPSFVEWRWKYR